MMEPSNENLRKIRKIYGQIPLIQTGGPLSNPAESVNQAMVHARKLRSPYFASPFGKHDGPIPKTSGQHVRIRGSNPRAARIEA